MMLPVYKHHNVFDSEAKVTYEKLLERFEQLFLADLGCHWPGYVIVRSHDTELMECIQPSILDLSVANSAMVIVRTNARSSS
jgi:hypothetical protein